jgi:hypothetical protein
MPTESIYDIDITKIIRLVKRLFNQSFSLRVSLKNLWRFMAGPSTEIAVVAGWLQAGGAFSSQVGAKR